MGILDWVVLIFSIGFIVLYGIWKNIKNKDLQEYFKGSNKSRWWTIGISVMATQASAITFLSTPGQAYSDGMGFIQFYFGLPFAIIIISIFLHLKADSMHLSKILFPPIFIFIFPGNLEDPDLACIIAPIFFFTIFLDLQILN